MLKTRMTGTRINDRGKSELVDTVQTLKQRMLYDAVEQSTWYLNESEDGVVDDLGFLHRLLI